MEGLGVSPFGNNALIFDGGWKCESVGCKTISSFKG